MLKWIILIWMMIGNSVPKKPTVLMIGDSLTCMAYGDRMESKLKQIYGEVHVLAACGSSPETWMSGMRSYHSRCGTKNLEPWGGTTPKMADLLDIWHPDIIIISLGTNHFDAVKESGSKIIPHLGYLYSKFITEASSKSAKIIWVGPPDSSKFRGKVQESVCEEIQTICKAKGVQYIPSSTFTSYSGSDGVHYTTKGAVAWADKVIERISYH